MDGSTGYNPLKAQVMPPSGLPTIDSIQPREFQAMLMGQLREADIAIPSTVDLFPRPGVYPAGEARPSRNRSTRGNLQDFMRPREANYLGIGPTSLIGISSASFGEFLNFRTTLPANERNNCTTNTLLENPRALRVLAAIHETAHAVTFGSDMLETASDALTGRMDASFKSTNPNLPMHVMGNVRERIGDVAAALYIRSNFQRPTDGSDILSSVRDFRLASRQISPDHNTVSSLDMVSALPQEQIPASLTIVQATRMAADLIIQQPGLDNELNTRLGPSPSAATANARRAESLEGARRICLPARQGRPDFE